MSWGGGTDLLAIYLDALQAKRCQHAPRQHAQGLVKLARAGLHSQRSKGPPTTSFLSSIWMTSGEICGLYNLKTGRTSHGERSPRELRQAVLLHHLFGLAPTRKPTSSTSPPDPASVSLIWWTFLPSLSSQKRPEAFSNLTPGPLG